MYNNEDDHITVKILKKKGWKIFEIYFSRHKSEYGGWWIDTAIAFNTKYSKSHKAIHGKFLGVTLKEALYTLRHHTFPKNN